MSNPVSITPSNSHPGRRVTVAAPMTVLAAAAGITGYAVACLRQQRRHMPHTLAGGDERISAPPGLPPSPVTSPADTGTHHGTDPSPPVAGHLERAIARRPRLAIAATALIVAVVTATVGTLFLTPPEPRNPIADTPHRVAPLPETPAPTDPLLAQLIPAAESGEACRDDCGDRTGQRFTLEFFAPWVVTEVGFRSLDLVPGRRVTKLRWELNDPELTVFPQYEDSTDGHHLSLAHLRDGYRTRRITAVVEATVADSRAVLATSSARPPLVAYGHPADSAADAIPAMAGHTDPTFRRE